MTHFDCQSQSELLISDGHPCTCFTVMRTSFEWIARRARAWKLARRAHARRRHGRVVRGPRRRVAAAADALGRTEGVGPGLAPTELRRHVRRPDAHLRPGIERDAGAQRSTITSSVLFPMLLSIVLMKRQDLLCWKDVMPANADNSARIWHSCHSVLC